MINDEITELFHNHKTWEKNVKIDPEIQRGIHEKCMTRLLQYNLDIYKVVISVWVSVCLSDHYSWNPLTDLPKILIG